MYKKAPESPEDIAIMDEDILTFWKENNSFKESVKNRENAQEFVFYDGPPFANGLPHYGHLLTSYIKDSVARFQTLIGNKVERRFGWDCHGLPAEMETEKELKISGRSQIMEYGISLFNKACRSSVMKYSKQWEDYIEKAGRWVDFREEYKTMDTSYMESVLWAFKELYKKGLIYEDFRVMPYSWKCETPLSNFETRMDNSYRSHTSKSVSVKLELLNPPKELAGIKTFILLWTTTPWSFAGNLLVAIGKNFDYVALKKNGEAIILAKKLAPNYIKELGNEVIATFKGEHLVGLSYKPVFPFFETWPSAFKIVHGSFVEEEDGTGLVSIAPGFGEEDWVLARSEGVKIVCPVDEGGKFTSDLYPYYSLETEDLSFEDITADDEELIKVLLFHHKEMAFEKANEKPDFFILHKKQYGAAPLKVIWKKTGVIIGIAGLIVHELNIPLIEGNVEIICFLIPDFQKKGLGSKIMNLFLKYAFTRYNIDNVIAVISGNNPASETMLYSCGFEYKEEIIDPYLKTPVRKFLCKKSPDNFKIFNIKFRKEDNIPDIFKLSDCKFISQPWIIYDKKSNLPIGLIELSKDNFLNYFFIPNVLADLRVNIIKDFLEKISYYEVIFEGELNEELKRAGFFKFKNLVKRNSRILYLQGKQVFEANDDIISFLKSTGSLVRQEQYIHNYPHCWRTDTPLIYKAVSSFYVKVTQIKEQMVQLNKEINWIPGHIKEGQFGKWLENARDWSITRNRFWGTPVPVWKVYTKEGKEVPPFNMNYETFDALKDALNILAQQATFANAGNNEFWNIKISNIQGEEKFFPRLEEALAFAGFNNEGDTSYFLSYYRNYVFGSIKELEVFFDKTDIRDLHRPYIDELERVDPHNPDQKIVRIPDVFDCWFESGSMPFASIHYPFESNEWFETHIPADFITEYIAQTRGWFYTLMVLSTALFNRIPFKTCICHGVILDSEGQKLSKRLKNYPDPIEMFSKYGSDAMRWFLLSSHVLIGGDLNISPDGSEVRDIMRLIIKPIWSTYHFFSIYSNSDKIFAEYQFASTNIMDKYLFSKLFYFAREVKVEMENYNFASACRKIEAFIDILNNWYIRRNKERFWKPEIDEDKIFAYNTLYTVLLEFCKIISPILPFTSENVYQRLTFPNKNNL